MDPLGEQHTPHGQVMHWLDQLIKIQLKVII
jgi:hypothetical protein